EAFLAGRPEESDGHRPPPVALWAHGDLPGASVLAGRFGFTPARTLLRMARPLGEALHPEAESALSEPPDGGSIRTFERGKDDSALLDLNARAFADHPEQGGLTQCDLNQRMDADWFDPAGLFLAERDGELLGFHWTKVHAEENAGEIYVLGVAPKAQGLGLGSLLTQAGLAYLAERGLPKVILYVEGDNAPALAVYRNAGFTVAA